MRTDALQCVSHASLSSSHASLCPPATSRDPWLKALRGLTRAHSLVFTHFLCKWYCHYYRSAFHQLEVRPHSYAYPALFFLSSPRLYLMPPISPLSTFHDPRPRKNEVQTSLSPDDHTALVPCRLYSITRPSIPILQPMLLYFHSELLRLDPLTKSSFIGRRNEVWSQHGFPSMPGHAFRIGGTTEPLLQRPCRRFGDGQHQPRMR